MCGETFLGALGPLDPYCSNLEADTYTCSCSPAPSYAWQDQGCVPCPRDTYRDRAAYTACLSCDDPLLPSRAIAANGDCACNQGYYQGADDMCHRCPRGSFKSSISNSRICTLCPTGKTTNEQAATSADDCMCPPGTTPQLAGIITVPDDGGCRLCDAGSENPIAGGNCSACAAGSVTAARGTAKCALCPAGFYAEDAMRCRHCPAGTYADNMGSTNCTPCAANSFSRFNGSQSCGLCAAATYAEAGGSQCRDCYSNVLRLRWLSIGPRANTIQGYYLMPLLLLVAFLLGVIGMVLATRYRMLLSARQASQKDAVIGMLLHRAQHAAPVAGAPASSAAAPPPQMHRPQNQIPRAPGTQGAAGDAQSSVELEARLFDVWQHAEVQKMEKTALEQRRMVHAPYQALEPEPHVLTSVSATVGCVAEREEPVPTAHAAALPASSSNVPTILLTRPVSSGAVSHSSPRGRSSSRCQRERERERERQRERDRERERQRDRERDRERERERERERQRERARERERLGLPQHTANARHLT